MSEDQRQENQEQNLGRDPNRPGGSFLVLIALVALIGFMYIMWPVGSPQSTSATGGGGPSAMTNPAQSPTGK